MDAERTYFELLADGDPEATADYEQWPGIRRFDAVGCWPRDRLDELVKARPDLLDEIKRRRPSEVEQA